MNQIKYKKGNLVDAFINNEINVLIHQANCFNTMGSGVAKEIKARLPEMFQADCETIKGHVEKLGSYSCAIFEGDDGELKYGFNLYSQYRYGVEKQHTNYDKMKKGLTSIKNYLDLSIGKTKKKVGIPKLGCGLGGGDWSVVSDIVSEIFVEQDYEIYVYEL